MARKSGGWLKVITNLLLVIPSILKITRHLVSQLEYELRQAKKGLITLFVLALIGNAIMIGTWFCLCGIVFLVLQNWMSALVALAMLLLIHLVFLLIIGIWMSKAKKKLLFPKLRKLVRNSFN